MIAARRYVSQLIAHMATGACNTKGPFMNRFRAVLHLTTASLAITCFGLTDARAQTAEPTAQPVATDPPASASGDIVVTARKRAERLQDIPVSVAVIGAADIARQGIRSLNDVARVTPGLQVSQGFGPDDIRPTLRGISTLRGRPSVALLEDGIDGNGAAIGTAGGGSVMNMGLLDIERVEIVRGPQSALYGRNAFAGAINYVTKRPTTTFEAGVSAESATHNAYDVTGFVSGPISDTLRFRINGAFHSFDGFYSNAINNAAIGEERSAGVRAQLEYAPTSDLDILLRYSYSRTRNAQAAASLETFNVTTPGGFKYVRGAVKADPNDITYFGDLPGLTSHVHKASLDVSYDLGGATLTSTTFGLIYDADQSIDASWAQEPALPFGFSVRQLFNAKLKTRQVSEELRLQSQGTSRFKWTVGGYFLYEDAQMQDLTQAFYASCANPLSKVRPGIGCSPALNQVSLDLSDQSKYPASFEKRKTTHFSAYASLGYELLRGLSLTAEARIARETIDVAHAPIARSFAELGFASFTGGPFTSAYFLPTGGYALPPTETASSSITYFNPRLAIDYKISRDLMLYASYAKGTKPGGFSQITNTERYDLSRYAPEKLYSSELGFKASAIDKRLIVDVSGFYSIYRDQQINYNQTVIVGGIPVQQNAVGNAGRAKSYGVEVQASLRPVKPLFVNIGYTHTISKYTDFIQSADSAALALFNGGDVSGNYLPDVPKNSWTVDARYEAKIGNGQNAFFQATESYVGKRSINSDSTNQAYLAHYYQTDATIGIDDPRWTFAIFAKNLLDDRTPRAAFRYLNLASATASDQAVVVMLPPERQYGVRTSFRF